MKSMWYARHFGEGERTPRHSSAIVSAVTFSLVATTTPSVLAFDPVSCAPCGTGWSPVGYSWVTDPSDDPMANTYAFAASNDGLATDGTAGNHYVNNIDAERLFVANRYVRGVQFHHSEFMTEAGWDYLSLSHADGPTTAVFSGAIDTAANAATDGWFEVPGTGSLRLSRTPAGMSFVTDASYTEAGFQLNQARICCGATQAELPVANVSWGARYSGVLAGTGDVVFLKIGAASSAATAIHIPLWATYVGVTFNMKARCNALPTATTYDFSAAAGGRWNYLRIPYVASC